MHQKLYKWIDEALEDREIDLIDVSAWLSHGWSLVPPSAPEITEPAREKVVPEPAAPEVTEPARKKVVPSETK